MFTMSVNEAIRLPPKPRAICSRPVNVRGQAPSLLRHLKLWLVPFTARADTHGRAGGLVINIWDLYQQYRISELDNRVSSMQGSRNQDNVARDAAFRLEDKVELRKNILEVDLRDGQADGRMTLKAKKCPKCDAMISPQFGRCLFCGYKDESAGRFVTAGVREQSKVLVFRQEYSRLGTSQSENSSVLGASTDLHHGGDIVTCRTESRHDGKVAALVDKETHRLLFGAVAFGDEDHFLVGERVRRVPHRGLDILARQARIGVQEICLRSPFAQLAKDQLDRNSHVNRIPRWSRFAT